MPPEKLRMFTCPGTVCVVCMCERSTHSHKKCQGAVCVCVCVCVYAADSLKKNNCARRLTHTLKKNIRTKTQTQRRKHRYTHTHTHTDTHKHKLTLWWNQRSLALRTLLLPWVLPASALFHCILLHTETHTHALPRWWTRRSLAQWSLSHPPTRFFFVRACVLPNYCNCMNYVIIVI
jgi:hypothetical protein